MFCYIFWSIFCLCAINIHITKFSDSFFSLFLVEFRFIIARSNSVPLDSPPPPLPPTQTYPFPLCFKDWRPTTTWRRGSLVLPPELFSIYTRVRFLARWQEYSTLLFDPSSASPSRSHPAPRSDLLTPLMGQKNKVK